MCYELVNLWVINRLVQTLVISWWWSFHLHHMCWNRKHLKHAGQWPSWTEIWEHWAIMSFCFCLWMPQIRSKKSVCLPLYATHSQQHRCSGQCSHHLITVIHFSVIFLTNPSINFSWSRIQLLTSSPELHPHITSVLKQLHWHPIYFCINFKILLTFKALYKKAPPNLTNLQE